MNITIKQETLDAAVQKTFLENMTEEFKLEILKGAVAKMFEKERDRYGSVSASMVEQAFNTALFTYLRKYAQDVVENDPVFKGKVRELYTEITNEIFGSQRAAVVSSMATAIVEGMEINRRNR
jgi:hypothetical protein